MVIFRCGTPTEQSEGIRLRVAGLATADFLHKEFAGSHTRRVYMKKKKIAESIIIRVGGGIREIPRESVEITEKQEFISPESGFEKTEETRSFGAEPEANTKAVSGKTIN